MKPKSLIVDMLPLIITLVGMAAAIPVAALILGGNLW